jgi:N-methylhydantoinase A
MQSNGGIADAGIVRDRAVTTCLSGPAAGVVGARATAEDATGTDGIVTFDMGGTSSDVSLVRGGEIERTTEAEIGDRPVGVPMVDVTTVGAGGGSLAWVDAGGALRVGPESAGAEPGPACYGRGGTDPTVTDATVVLGYVGADAALGGELSLDADAARDALADLASEADLEDAVEAARGVYRVANANMTRAVRAVTVERGHDPRNFALAAFGGAGPMHAAALADRLDVGRVVVPRACGVLSAYGLLAADETRDAVRTYRTALDAADPEVVEDVEGVLADLADEARSGLREPTRATISRRADLRYEGQSFELPVDVDDEFDPETVARRFHDAHETAYGYRMDEPVELVGLQVRTTVRRANPDVAYESEGGEGNDPQIGEREAFFAGEFRETSVYRREALPAGSSFAGPAICEQVDSTVVVPPEWWAEVQDDGTLVLTNDDRGAETGGGA